MIRQAATGSNLSAEVIEQIRLQTDGVPLFVEELTKSVVEAWRQGTGDGGREGKPVSVLWTLAFVRADLIKARELANSMLQSIREGDPSIFPAVAYTTLSATLSHLGEFATAREYALRAQVWYESPDTLPVRIVGHDEEVINLCYAAWASLILGFADQARTLLERGLQRAEDLHHSFSQAVAFGFVTILSAMQQEPVKRTDNHATKLISLSTDHRFPLWLGYGVITQG